LAKTIYDYWFVQFDFPDENGKPYKSSGGKMVYNQELKREIPAGWEVKLLGEVLTIVRGSSPRPIDNFLSDNGLPWIKISDATSSNNRFIFETKQFILEEGIPYTRNIPPDTLILSNSATPGLPRIVKISAGVHDGWLIIMNYKKGLTQEFMYHYFSFEQRRVVSFGSGSIFKNLKTDYIKNLKIALPPKLILEKVSPKFKAISELISIKSQENQQLTQLRDWLLPMLMNGQITVK
ncbi:MAG: restriction endonuclease subunit S, partial [Dolichospermum sp.]